MLYLIKLILISFNKLYLMLILINNIIYYNNYKIITNSNNF